MRDIMKNLLVSIGKAGPLKQVIHDGLKEALFQFFVFFNDLHHFGVIKSLDVWLELCGYLIQLPQEGALEEPLLEEEY
jgi:hypothetical protein